VLLFNYRKWFVALLTLNNICWDITDWTHWNVGLINCLLYFFTRASVIPWYNLQLHGTIFSINLILIISVSIISKSFVFLRNFRPVPFPLLKETLKRVCKNNEARIVCRSRSRGPLRKSFSRAKRKKKNWHLYISICKRKKADPRYVSPSIFSVLSDLLL